MGRNTAVVVLTNTSATLSFGHIADRLALLMLPPTSVDTRARWLFAGMQAGALDRAVLKPEFSAFLDARRFSTYAASLGRLGAPDSFVLKSGDEADGVTTRCYEVSAGGQRLSIAWEESADGHTDEFAIQPVVEWEQSMQTDPQAAVPRTFSAPQQRPSVQAQFCAF